METFEALFMSSYFLTLSYIGRSILFWKRGPLVFIRFSMNLNQRKELFFFLIFCGSLYVYNRQHELGQTNFCKICTLLAYCPIFIPSDFNI